MPGTAARRSSGYAVDYEPFSSAARRLSTGEGEVMAAALEYAPLVEDRLWEVRLAGGRDGRGERWRWELLACLLG